MITVFAPAGMIVNVVDVAPEPPPDGPAPEPAPPTPAPTPAPSPSTVPAWRRNRPLMEAFEIPGTELSRLPPAPFPSTAKSLIEPWCGMTLDVHPITRAVMLLFGPGGGHADGWGTRVAGVNLMADAPAAEVIRETSVPPHVFDDAIVYGDLTRACLHNYYHLHIDPETGDLYVVSTMTGWSNTLPTGVTQPPTGWLWPRIETLPAAERPNARRPLMALRTRGDRQWTHPDDNGQIPFELKNSDITCMNPVTRDILVQRADARELWKFACATKQWSLVNGGPAAAYMQGGFRGAAIDPETGVMLISGLPPTTPARPPVLVDTATGVKLAATFGGLGPEVLRHSFYPAVTYDTLARRWAMLSCNSAEAQATVHFIDRDSLDVSRPAIGGVALPRSGTPQNTAALNRFRFIPELGGFVWVYAHDKPFIFIPTVEMD